MVARVPASAAAVARYSSASEVKLYSLNSLARRQVSGHSLSYYLLAHWGWRGEQQRCPPVSLVAFQQISLRRSPCVHYGATSSTMKPVAERENPLHLWEARKETSRCSLLPWRTASTDSGGSRRSLTRYCSLSGSEPTALLSFRRLGHS